MSILVRELKSPLQSAVANIFTILRETMVLQSAATRLCVTMIFFYVSVKYQIYELVYL